jgi:hypothetical protein
VVYRPVKGFQIKAHRRSAGSYHDTVCSIILHIQLGLQTFHILIIKKKDYCMAKGQDSKKAAKKKPEKTMKEKRMDKKEKKASKN